MTIIEITSTPAVHMVRYLLTLLIFTIALNAAGENAGSLLPAQKLDADIKALEVRAKYTEDKASLLVEIEGLLKANASLQNHTVEVRAFKLLLGSLEAAGRSEEALSIYVPQALEAAKRTERADYWRASVLRAVVSLWNSLGKRHENIPVYLDMIETAKRSDLKSDLSYALRGLGDYYTAVSKPEKAKELLLQALEAAEQAKSQANLGACRESLGEQAVAINAYDDALTHYNKALEHHVRNKSEGNQIDIMINLGRLELRRSDPAAAAKHFERAIEIANLQGASLTGRKNQAIVGLAAAYREQGRPQEGKVLLDPIASRFGKTRRALEVQIRFVREYSLTLEAVGDHRGALDYARKLAEMIEEFAGEQALDRLNEAEVSFGLAKKNLEIDLLKQKEMEREANLRAAAADLRTAQSQAEREHAQRNFALLSFGLGGIALVGLGVAVFTRLRDRQKADRLRMATERKMLEAKRLESLGVLASGIAHDFNNLLTVIIGNAELLKSDPRFSGQSLPEIASVLQASQQASALCRQMLQYSGKEYANLAEIDLVGVLGGVIAELRPTAPKCRFVFPDAGTALPVLADLAQIRQLLHNLIANALESIDGKSGTIELQVQQIDVNEEVGLRYTPAIKPGRYCCLEIRDDGPGISAENLGRIFEPFFTTKFLGRGLGLSVVAGILRNHHGGVMAESLVGRGATFRVLLPMRASAKPTEPTATRSVPAVVARRKSRAGQPAVVLLADDEEMVRNVVATQLQNLGCKVIVAANGEQAIELHRKHLWEITVALLDLEMPIKNGIETLNAIKTADPALPVYLLSGYSEPGELGALAKNIAGFLPKPISQADLKRMLEASAGE